MSSGLLPDHIEPLVDRLRSGDHLPISLPDVAAVTEVLMRSLESYFKSIDLTLYKECQELADYIDEARSEITSLSTTGEDSAGIPRAGKELDAIVEATESATDTIMQAAEDLMSFDSDNFEEYKEHINTEVMKIFEACSFQDITGQRISKVVKTLNHVEDRVGKLISILGITNSNDTPMDATSILGSEDGEANDDDLLHGPALAGEGIDQSEIDSLLNDSFDQQSDNTIEADVEAEVQTEVEAEVEAKVEVDAKVEVEAETETKVEAEVEAAIETKVEAEVVEVKAEAEVKAEVEVEVESETKVEAEVEAAIKTKIEAEVVEVKAEAKPEIPEEVQAAPKKTESADKIKETANGNKTTSQDDIDSLFG